MKKLLTILGVILFAMAITTPVYAADNSCKVIDGAYYGKNGKETDKGTYQKECESHSCELVADAYFGANGNEVTKEIFESECGALVYEYFPDTASDSATATLFIIIGLAIISGTVFVIRTVKEQ